MSRQSAFKVLSSYVEYLEPKEMVEFLETQIKPIVMDVPRPSRWRHLPSSKSRVQQHLGIVNLGCICYMISMLQQLFMVPEFRYQLLKAVDAAPVNIQEHKGDKIDDRLLSQLQKLFGFLELSDRHAYNPKELCYSIKDYDGTPIRIGEQKDSQEFVGVFFERLETLLKPTTQRYLLQDTFQGNMCSQFIC
jgi:ubiquitin C-terminal hydrolase